MDAATAMLAAVCVMNDSVSFGGELSGLIFDPSRSRVFAINGQGIAPSGATPEFFRSQGLAFPPADGPLAATTPGIPGALVAMLAEFGTMSLQDVLEPGIDLAGGYPVEAQTAAIYEEFKTQLEQWKYSREVFLPGGRTPAAGQIFAQTDLAETFRKMAAAEAEALAAGRGRKEALMAARDRFYRGDIAGEFVRASQEYGGRHTLEDLASTETGIEEPLHVNYRGLDVYKCNAWTQGATLLQALNILEGIDVRAYEHNSPDYIHLLYQTLNLAFADRDFYFGDPKSIPSPPIRGLLSRPYAARRRELIDPRANNPSLGPGDPYPFQGERHPFPDHLRTAIERMNQRRPSVDAVDRGIVPGTTSIQAADAEGWVVSLTPSGGWPPAFIAGRTGIGMSQRMQQFVVDASLNPYNVVAPRKRPRITISPTLVLRNGKPFLSSSVPGGDVQEQMQLQWLLNVLEFGMDVQAATEAPKWESFQLHGSFGLHPMYPGLISLDSRIPADVARALAARNYHPVVWKGGVHGEHGGSLTVLRVDSQAHILEGGQGIPDLQWAGPRYGIAW